jgi:hypothetical protein
VKVNVLSRGEGGGGTGGLMGARCLGVVVLPSVRRQRHKVTGLQVHA